MHSREIKKFNELLVYIIILYFDGAICPSGSFNEDSLFSALIKSAITNIITEKKSKKPRKDL
jgi:hypothetical protein